MLIIEMTNGSLEMRIGHEIPSQDYGILAATVNKGWDWLIEANPEIINGRFESGHPMVASYGRKIEGEEIEGVDLGPYDGQNIPIVFIEMVALVTGGDYKNVPDEYIKLTNKGLWAPIPKEPDTIILTDLTSIPSRRMIRPQVDETIGFTKRLLFGEIDHELPFDPQGINHIWTYSPDRPGVLKMHRDNGAEPTGHILPYARVPSDLMPHVDRGPIKEEMQRVHLMSYKG